MMIMKKIILTSLLVLLTIPMGFALAQGFPCENPFTSGDDKIIGDDSDNVLCGQKGNDKIIGAGGNDTLIGGPGNDMIIGGPGNDIFIDGPGKDVLIGGGGYDVFNLFPNDETDRVNCGGGEDTVYITSLEELDKNIISKNCENIILV